MRALRWHGRRDVRLEDVDDAPVPGPDEVRVAVEWCGICGTDLEEYTDGPIIIPTEPHPLTGLQAPMIIGHEVSGRVRDVGDGVDGLEPEQLVAIDGLLSCGRCRACREHAPVLCPRWASIGMALPGGLAEQLTVPAHLVVPASAEVASDELALAEPLSVAVRALRRGRLQPEDRVAVLGGGTIGLAVLQVARALGTSRVAVVDPLPFRRDMATRLGAAAAMSPDEDVAEALPDPEGLGPDLVVDCTGIPDGPAAAVSLARPGGRVVLVGISPSATRFDFNSVVLREIDVIGSLSHVYDEDFASAVELISTGRVDTASMITHRVPLERAVEDGIAFLAGLHRSEALKILIRPG